MVKTHNRTGRHRLTIQATLCGGALLRGTASRCDDGWPRKPLDETRAAHRSRSASRDCRDLGSAKECWADQTLRAARDAHPSPPLRLPLDARAGKGSRRTCRLLRATRSAQRSRTLVWRTPSSIPRTTLRRKPKRNRPERERAHMPTSASVWLQATTTNEIQPTTVYRGTRHQPQDGARRITACIARGCR